MLKHSQIVRDIFWSVQCSAGEIIPFLTYTVTSIRLQLPTQLEMRIGHRSSLTGSSHSTVSSDKILSSECFLMLNMEQRQQTAILQNNQAFHKQ